MKIPISKTILNEKEILSVLEPLRSGWLVQGPKVRDFEEKWCKFTKSKHSIAVTSCTTAMTLSLIALGFKEGDEAIVPAFTWISTANVVEQLGGKVVFCDINLDTFNLDLSQIEDKITTKTKVILPVHLFGLPVEMDPIIKLSKKYNLKLIEDAACGFGSFYKGKHVGSLGDTGCFSFHPRKSITTGEGGMITTQDDKIAEKIRILRDHGASISDLQRHHGPKPYILSDHTEAGYNSRLTDIQGALGLAQMDRANEILFERNKIATRYKEEFSKLSWLKTPLEFKSLKHGFQSFPCLYRYDEINIKNIAFINKKRNDWMEELQENGISTRPSTHSVHTLSYYKNKYKILPEEMPNSLIASECSISLPIYNGMTEQEQDYVIKKVTEHKI